MGWEVLEKNPFHGEGMDFFGTTHYKGMMYTPAKFVRVKGRRLLVPAISNEDFQRHSKLQFPSLILRMCFAINKPLFIPQIIACWHYR